MKNKNANNSYDTFLLPLLTSIEGTMHELKIE